MVQTPCINQFSFPSIPSTVMQIIVHNTLVRKTGALSTPRVQKTSTSSPSSSAYPDPTLASLLQRKKRSLRGIYNEDATDSFSVFPLFSKINDPLTFKAVLKDDIWAQAMDEEIKFIENN
jgi:hypothetical protein